MSTAASQDKLTSRGWALARATPVFVGGCPRSGTTLLGAMLGLGPQRLTVPEAMFKDRLLGCLTDDGRHLDPGAARRVLTADERLRLWRVPLPPGPEPSPIPYDALVTDLVARFGQRVGKPTPSLWVDHTPSNIRYAASFARLFPQAKFVNLVRDGRAVAASVLPLDWGPNTASEAAKWWGTHIAMGLAAERTLGEERILTVRFEDLVAAPEETLRRVCSFVGTAYDPEMVHSREYETAQYTVTDHRLVDDLPDRGRAQAWRRRLSAGQIQTFEHLTGELLGLLGYDMDYGPGAHLSPRRQRLAEFAVDVARRGVLNRVRRERMRRRVIP